MLKTSYWSPRVISSSLPSFLLLFFFLSFLVLFKTDPSPFVVCSLSLCISTICPWQKDKEHVVHPRLEPDCNQGTCSNGKQTVESLSFKYTYTEEVRQSALNLSCLGGASVKAHRQTEILPSRDPLLLLRRILGAEGFLVFRQKRDTLRKVEHGDCHFLQP